MSSKGYSKYAAPANLPEFETEAAVHHGKKVIFIRFPYNKKKIEQVKSIKARWSATQKAWYVTDSANMRELLGMKQGLPGEQVIRNIHPVNQPALKKLRDQIQLMGYSTSTLKTYTLEFAQLLSILNDVPVASLTPERLRAYCLYCINKLRVSENQMHSRINAIRFYFEKVLNKKDFLVAVPRPKKPSQLPKVLSTLDIQKLFRATANIKHRLMLQLSYGMGLRVSEIVSLKISDIDSRRMQVRIESAKGKKDRVVNLPESVLEPLRAYYKEYKPNHFLFQGVEGGQYSIRSVQAVFKNAMKKARINKPIGIHGLRHSYATHLHEYGTDITLIQKLLGHEQIKTTLTYTKISRKAVSNVKSPLDRMK